MNRFIKVPVCLMAAVLLLSGCAVISGFFGGGDEAPSSSGSSSELPPNTVDWDSVTLKQFTEPAAGEVIAVLHTSMGDVTVRFFPDEAPLAVENFIAHAQDGYYDGVLLHRVMYEFMIQGGDPTTRDPNTPADRYGRGGESIWGGGFADEFSPNLYNFRGALSMANTGEADSNGSQFFIVQASAISDALYEQMLDPEVWWFSELIADKYKEVGGAPWLDRRHTVFGQVVEGMDVVDNIAAMPVRDSENADPALRDYTPLTPIVITGVEITTMPAA